MKVNQLYPFLDVIAKDVTEGQLSVTNPQGFQAFVLKMFESDKMYDIVFRMLVDRIGMTTMDAITYIMRSRHVMVTPFEYGALLQKIHYGLINASEDSDWSFKSDENKSAAQNPYDIQPKENIFADIYEGIMPAFQYDDVILRRQVESGFLNEMAAAAFIDGIFQRMRASYELAKQNLEFAAINSSIASVYANKDSVNYSRRCRNLLKEYNTRFGKSLTKAEAETNPDFYKYVVLQLQILDGLMSAPTKLYNDGSVEKVSTSEDLIIEVSEVYARMLQIYLNSDTFNDQYLSLPNHYIVPYWQSTGMTTDIKVQTGVNEDNGDAVVTEVSGIVAYVRDKRAVACTLQRERTVTIYDEWNERTPVKMSAERRYIVDNRQNSVLFYIADEPEQSQSSKSAK